MADPEHVALVQRGLLSVAQWQVAHEQSALDLSNAALASASLADMDLGGANLSRGNFSNAHFFKANLTGATLTSANLAGASLMRCFLARANFQDANLAGADLSLSYLGAADFARADLSGAELYFANVGDADFGNAILRQADAGGATFWGSNFDQADLSGMHVGYTSFTAVDFSAAIGLGDVVHDAPSNIGIDCLIASFRSAGGRLTLEMESFFASAGVPSEVIALLPRIVAEVRYYSCFISYGAPDKEFAQNLYSDLKGRGVSCWLYDLDNTPGQRTWTEITGKRREFEKMVILCSAASLVRDGVLKEIEEQIDENPEKLIPVSLDNLWTQPGFRVVRGSRDLKPFLVDRNYADFANRPYDQGLARLLVALRRPEGET